MSTSCSSVRPGLSFPEKKVLFLSVLLTSRSVTANNNNTRVRAKTSNFLGAKLVWNHCNNKCVHKGALFPRLKQQACPTVGDNPSIYSLKIINIFVDFDHQ